MILVLFLLLRVPPQPPHVTSTHLMTTRSKSGTLCPRQIFNLSEAYEPSPIPRSYTQALHDPNWKASVDAELTTLHTNDTWDLVPPPSYANLVGSMWIYPHKFHLDASLKRYKSRLVVLGKTQ